MLSSSPSFAGGRLSAKGLVRVLSAAFTEVLRCRCHRAPPPTTIATQRMLIGGLLGATLTLGYVFLSILRVHTAPCLREARQKRWGAKPSRTFLGGVSGGKTPKSDFEKHFSKGQGRPQRPSSLRGQVRAAAGRWERRVVPCACGPRQGLADLFLGMSPRREQQRSCEGFWGESLNPSCFP